LTARIEEVTEAGEVLISENTRRELSQTLNIIESRTLRAKGFKAPITIHKVCCKPSTAPEAKDAPEAALPGVEHRSVETQHA